MADCGICLDPLRNPVSIPCGHVHCERCLRAHIGTGTDALMSACPTCRKQFHIATPDFAFVPQKYHNFMLPSVRKLYLDLPSLLRLGKEVDVLTQRLERVENDKEYLDRRCANYKHTIETMTLEHKALVEQGREAQEEAADIYRKYESLKKKYWELKLCDDTSLSQSSRGSSQSFDASRKLLPKLEEHPVSLQDLDPIPPRPKRALPKSRLLSGSRHKDEPAKRQRIHRYSDVPSSSQRTIKYEDEDED